MEPAAVFHSYVKMETMIEDFSNRFTKGSRAPSSQLHTVVFAVKKYGINQLRDILDDISDPYSLNYGNHLTREEVTKLTINIEGSNHLLLFLRNLSSVDGHVEIISTTNNMDYITARAPVKLWERILNAELYQFHSKNEIKLEGLTLNPFYFN